MIHGVVLAGGKGERFWPLSRKARPKQLVRFGQSTLLEQAYHRLSQSCQEIQVITGQAIADKVSQLLPDARVLVETVGRNTGPACFYTAALALRSDPDAVMVVAPSDHVIKDTRAFASCVQLAVQLAEQGYLVTFGVKPTRPETGYGYIERDQQLAQAHGTKAYRAKAFHEKPDIDVARQYLSSGRFYWNSGMFVWRADVLVEQFKKHRPDVVQALPPEMNLDLFCQNAPSISVDYAVMEKAEKVAVVEAIFDWEDAGSFASLPRVFEPDQAGNVVWGQAVHLDVENSVLASENGVVAALGVKDIIVVHTPDATLVLPVSRAQEVKALLEIIREKGLEHLL